MSGTGGSLIYTILQKSQPVDMVATLPLILGENAVGTDDQVLNLMQMYFERSDSVNSADISSSSPLRGSAGATPCSVRHQ